MTFETGQDAITMAQHQLNPDLFTTCIRFGSNLMNDKVIGYYTVCDNSGCKFSLCYRILGNTDKYFFHLKTLQIIFMISNIIQKKFITRASVFYKFRPIFIWGKGGLGCMHLKRVGMHCMAYL